ncbi:MAG: hypothetical protein ABSG64_00555 [Solirubrobacteraceae bacterium]
MALLLTVLKLPVVGLLWFVWRIMRQSDDEPLPAGGQDDGRRLHAERHPRPPFPRKPRRGPHGATPIPAPPRVRTLHARARKIEH